MKTDELTKKSCAVSPTGKHVMEVARMRGNRHRTRCKHCGVFSQWEKKEANNYQAKAQNFARLAEAPDFTKMTVPALKEYAQKNDIVINSKMKKAELIAACSA